MSYIPSIMMIDDNPSTNLYHKIMIDSSGIKTKEVKDYISSEEAINDLRTLCEQKEYDRIPNIILIDINMPVKNGWDVLDEIRQLNLGDKNPEVYMVSNSRHPSDLKKAENDDLVIDIMEKHLEQDFFNKLASR